MNLASGYHQIRIALDNEEKTVFWMQYSHFEFKVMLFRLTNTLAIFIGLMNKILQLYLDKLVLVFLDNILIYSALKEQHLNDIRTVLEIL